MDEKKLEQILNNQEQINNRLVDLTSENVVSLGQLEQRVTTLEKMIAKVPEFYEYWKRLNACGYQD